MSFRAKRVILVVPTEETLYRMMRIPRFARNDRGAESVTPPPSDSLLAPSKARRYVLANGARGAGNPNRRPQPAANPGIHALLAALATNRLLMAMLFEVTPSDPVTLASALLSIVAASLAAAIFPVAASVRIQPNAALRTD